jgi:hypothetical protein
MLLLASIALPRLLHLLDESVPWGEPPTLVRLFLRDDGAEVGLKPLDGHPVETLGGFRAPRSWDGAGVVAEGWAVQGHEVGGSGSSLDLAVRPSLHPHRFRVRTLSLILRSGEEADGLAQKGAALQVMEERSTGALAFTLRRMLGLPSCADPPNPVELFAVVWLAEMLAEVADGTTLAPSTAAAMHPAVRMLAADGEDPAAVDLVEAGAALGRVATWRFLRKEAIAGRFPYADVDSRRARWMDDEMFGASVMSGLPPAAELLNRLKAAAPTLVGDVERVLRLWAIL